MNIWEEEVTPTWDGDRYLCKVFVGANIREMLGIITQRNEKDRTGRWNWFRKPSRYQIGWKTGQGVANSREEAVAAIESGWEEVSHEMA